MEGRVQQGLNLNDDENFKEAYVLSGESITNYKTVASLNASNALVD